MRGKKLKQDLALNTFCSFFITVSVILVVKKAGSVFAPAALGIFLLSRRVAETIANFLQLGTSQTLRRYLPMTEDSSIQLLHIIAVLNVFAVMAIVFVVSLVGGLEYWTGLIFPDNSGSQSVVFWLGMLAIAIVIHFFASSILLSYRRVLASNMVNLSGNVWLLAGMWWWQKNSMVKALLRLQTIAMVILSSLVIAVVIMRLGAQLPKLSHPVLWRRYRHVLGETISYGLPRGAISFLEMSLFLIGPFLIRHEVEEAGYLIISFTFLRIGRTLIQPAARIISIAVAKLVGQRDETSLKQGITLLLGTLIYTSCLLLAVLLPWTKLLLQVWLGDSALAQKVYQYVVVLMFAMPFLTVFQGLKETIEMIWKCPFNLFTLSGSILLLVIWFYVTNIFLPASVSIIYGYLGILGIICVVTVVWIRKYLKPFKYFSLGKLLIVSILIWILNWLLAHWLSFASIWLNVAGAVSIGGLSVIAAIVFLYFYRPSTFIREAKQFLLPKLGSFVLFLSR